MLRTLYPCNWTQDLCFLLDEINLSTAMHRMAKLSRKYEVRLCTVLSAGRHACPMRFCGQAGTMSWGAAHPGHPVLQAGR